MLKEESYKIQLALQSHYYHFSNWKKDVCRISQFFNHDISRYCLTFKLINVYIQYACHEKMILLMMNILLM